MRSFYFLLYQFPLEDISKNENPDIRYYSGTIWYETEFKLKKKPEGELYLNLNDVGVMAKVKINGQYAGGVWTAPYRVNLTAISSCSAYPIPDAA